MDMYSRQKIADWFIARYRTEERLNDDTKPITQMKLNNFISLAQRIYLELYGDHLFYDTSQSKNSPELDDCISDERAIQLANNFDQILSDKKASAVLDEVWREWN